MYLCVIFITLVNALHTSPMIKYFCIINKLLKIRSDFIYYHSFTSILKSRMKIIIKYFDIIIFSIVISVTGTLDVL